MKMLAAGASVGHAVYTERLQNAPELFESLREPVSIWLTLSNWFRAVAGTSTALPPSEIQAHIRGCGYDGNFARWLYQAIAAADSIYLSEIAEKANQ